MSAPEDLRPGDLVDIVITGARISDKHVADKRLWFVLDDGSYHYLPRGAACVTAQLTAAPAVEPVAMEDDLPAYRLATPATIADKLARADLGTVIAELMPDLPVVTAAVIPVRLEQAGYRIVRRADIGAADVAAPAGPATTTSRCDAAHADDTSPCDGPARAVRILDQTGAESTGCVRHGAVLLATLDGGRVYPGPDGRGTDAIDTYKLAQAVRPGTVEVGEGE